MVWHPVTTAMESEWRAKHAGGRGWLLWLVGSRKAFGEEEALHLGLQVGGAHKAVEGGRGPDKCLDFIQGVIEGLPRHQLGR